MYQRVLVPVDGSDLCEPAIAQVSQLAGPDAEVVIVEVIDSAARIMAQTTPAGFAWSDGAISADIVTDVIAAQREAAEAHLGAARALLEGLGMKNVETRILEGIPGPAIVELAEQLAVDVVVMATHGRSGLRRAVLGSVADHVVRHLHGIPVLLVHPGSGESAPAAAAAEAGAGGR